jgi:CBS-domain-containing membrane protein
MLADWQHYALLMAPFGATMVILFALPDSPLAQPRNIVGGHLLTTLVGFAVLALMTVNPLSLGLAVGAGIVLMQLSGTTHPPAGANPLLVMTTLPTLDFVLTPVLAGTLLIVAFGVVYHRSVGRFCSGLCYVCFTCACCYWLCLAGTELVGRRQSYAAADPCISAGRL